MHNEYTDSTDEAIAQLVQQGSIQAFGELVERYEEKMMRYARRFLFQGTDAEDIVQDVFLKAYKHIQSFDTERKFSSWLYRIAHNEMINRIKKKGKEPIPFFDPDTLFPHPVAQEQTDKDVQEKELKAMIEKGLNHLDPKYREPLVLYYFEDQSYQEISEILRIPTSTVGVRIRRGKQQLHKTLEA